jgi:hypothetical protein
MGLLNRIFGRGETRAATDGSMYGSAFAAGHTAAGHMVNARVVENLATALASIAARAAGGWRWPSIPSRG